MTGINELSNLDDNDYIIGPGDRLRLNVLDDRTLNSNLEVLNDGSVTIPIIGPVKLMGRTLSQSSTLIKNLLSTQLLRPAIQLSLIRPRPIRVALIGEVFRPGLYTLTTRESLGTEGAIRVPVAGLPTLVDAIQKAGGITQVADLNNILLQRRLPGLNLSYKQASIDIIDLIEEGDQKNNPFLFDGDIIRIPKSDNPPTNAVEIATINLSPQSIQVNIIGEVEKSGKLTVDANTPLSQAILMAGGAHDWRANIKDVQLVRVNRDGSATLKRFTLDISKGASNDYNPILRNNDTIRINKNLLAKSYDAIETIVDPFGDILQAIALYNTLDETFNLELKETFILNERDDNLSP